MRAPSQPGFYHSGVSLVEVLIALSVLVINVLTWNATLHLLFAILRGMGTIEAHLDEDMTFAALCGALAVPVRRMGPAMEAGEPRSSVMPRSRSGATLVEMLVAAGIATMLLVLLATTLVMARRSANAAQARSEAITVRVALPALLHETIHVAGRGVEGGGAPPCPVEVMEAGRRLVLHRVEHGELLTDEVLAGRDGGGRPALYLRRLPHPRQPWIEDVTSFSVIPIEDVPTSWVRSLHVEVEHRSLDRPLRVVVPLLHHPCIAWNGS